MKTVRQKPESSIIRQSFIARASAASAAVALSPLGANSLQAAENQPAKFRFVFMPCIHLRRDLRSPEGFVAALQAVRKLSPAPDFILTGGDMCHQHARPND
jgi:3',5'-cyclic-AMP phosphodiesterase